MSWVTGVWEDRTEGTRAPRSKSALGSQSEGTGVDGFGGTPRTGVWGVACQGKEV